MFLKFGSSKTSKKRKSSRLGRGVKVFSLTTLIILAMACLFGTVAVGFVVLDRYVNKTAALSERIGSVELFNVPSWFNESLRAKIHAAIGQDVANLTIDEGAARSVRDNLVNEFVWLDETTVQITHDSIRVSGLWRKPIAQVKFGLKSCYVDADLVVLDFVSMPNLPIVKITGLSVTARIPPPGNVWQKDDLAAAVDVLNRLDKMDQLVAPDNPLLFEIDRIDVGNFNGNRSSRTPHIMMYAKDNTQIIWGAEIGTWQRYLEATDEDKLNRLYSHYKEYGSLMNNAKYINLREPQDRLSLPIDRY
jgi:hypothetical protein